MTTEKTQQDACHATDCAEAVAVIHQFLDTELTESNRREIQQHLDECPGCYQAFGFESDLRSVISDRLQPQIPEGLKERIRNALAAD